MSQTDVLSAALADALAVKAKSEEMAKHRSGIDRNGKYVQYSDPTRDDYEPSDAVRDLRTKPLRIDVDFKDPIKTRRQLEILAGALVRALAFSREHDRGAYNQLADMRHVLRMAVIEIQHLRGKTSAGTQD